MSREQRAESREQRAESREQRVVAHSSAYALFVSFQWPGRVLGSVATRNQKLDALSSPYLTAGRRRCCSTSVGGVVLALFGLWREERAESREQRGEERRCHRAIIAVSNVPIHSPYSVTLCGPKSIP